MQLVPYINALSGCLKFHRLKPHAADPSQILSSKVLRISLGLKLSELSELPVPGSLAAWLPGSLMALWLPGSRAPPGHPKTYVYIYI